MTPNKLLVASGLLVTLVWVGCRESERAAQPEPSVEAEEQARLEQAAAQRREETAALGESVAALESSSAGLQGQAMAGGASLPEGVAAGVGAVPGRMAEVQRLLAAVEQADAAGWEGARDRLRSELDAARAAHDAAAARLAEWRAKEQEALAKRTPLRMPIDPETGLIAGLDGGEYPHYHAFKIERLQQRLRELGLYAGAADGYLDEVTLEAVGRFQEQSGLHVSGVPSPMTRALLWPG